MLHLTDEMREYNNTYLMSRHVWLLTQNEPITSHTLFKEWSCVAILAHNEPITPHTLFEYIYIYIYNIYMLDYIRIYIYIYIYIHIMTWIIYYDPKR